MSTASEIIEIQTITYCKGWYKKTDTISDLKVFHGKWAGMNPEHIDEQDVLWFISMIYEKYMKKKLDMFQFLKEAFAHRSMWPKKSITIVEMIEYIESILHLGVMTADIPVWPNLDPTLLPLKDENSQKRWDAIHKKDLKDK